MEGRPPCPAPSFRALPARFPGPVRYPFSALHLQLTQTQRTNIGNAKIQGMTEDLKMKNQDYNIALFVFFIPYILFEVPSNLILKKLAPSTWLSGIMVLWGSSSVE